MLVRQYLCKECWRPAGFARVVSVRVRRVLSWRYPTLYIHTMDDMIHSVSQSAPALVPLFRSDHQMRILGFLFARSFDEVSLGELSIQAGVPQATVSREIARLEAHGLVVSRQVGRTKLVRPNWDLPWAPELRSILMQTVGVLGALGAELQDVEGIEEAFVFGSWAARYTGAVGHQPADIDVVIVGEASLRDVRAACRRVQDNLRVEVNPIVVDRQRWDGEDDPFVAQLQEQPLVPIAVGNSA